MRVRNPYPILALACAAMFITVVDLTVVNVSLPHMAIDLRLGQATLQWVVIAYAVPFGGLLLPAGRFGDVWGRRPVLLTGLAVFTAASLSAGLAGTSAVLIGSRAVQGIGAALIAPSALAVVADVFPAGKTREAALGIYGAIGGAAASVGVLAGGLLTDGPGWPWIFYVNVPICTVLLVAVVILLPARTAAAAGSRVDVRSAAAVTGGLAAGIYALDRGVVDGWTSLSALGPAVLAVALLATFVAVERNTTGPLMPVSLRRNRAAVLADLVALAGFGSFYGFIFLTTLLMQQQLGYSPTRTGLAWLITSLTAFVVAGLTGALLARVVGGRVLMLVASGLMVAAATVLLGSPAHPSFLTWVLPALVCAGIAVGLIAPSIQITALDSVGERDFGTASGLLETAREFGGSTIIALVSTVMVSGGRSATDGMHSAFGVIAAAAAFSVVVGAFGLRAIGSGRAVPEVPVPVTA
ncbi:MFS transporter [Nocardia stercoris]|uniref:MFS transporter n=1 Tax=Nocardia stercoris TaxID=2483361 RepID=A0A3M2KVK7_9NOCA|nr:MFS transporter [Nocardia stercoris]